MLPPKFTFLLPAYKARFLEDALRSILGQTFGDFCVLVSDDASPEPIEEIVRRCDDRRISFRRNPQNMGAVNLVDHWNLLLDICESEYVIVASDDDLYSPLFLEQINCLTAKHSKVDLFRVSVKTIDESGRTLKEETGRNGILSTESFVHHLLDPKGVLCVGNYVMRTSALKKIGGFVHFPLAWKADSATMLALSRKGVAVSSESLFSFRMSGINISSKSGKQASVDRQKLTATLSFYSWLQEHLDGDLMAHVGSLIKRKLDGEIRTYIWSLNFKEFCSLYLFMSKGKWFYTIRNQISFPIGWVMSKMRTTTV